MGSKRWMLDNSLGELLIRESHRAERFVDLFCGSGVVSWFVAERVNVPVLAVDLQHYSATLARAVISRDNPLAGRIGERWLREGLDLAQSEPVWCDAAALSLEDITHKRVGLARRLSSLASGVVTKAYGGYYLSPLHGLLIDALATTAPRREPHRSVCLAALTIAASRSVAAPGHTAQPLRPSVRALPHIKEAWKRDFTAIVGTILAGLLPRHALTPGHAIVAEATSVISRLANRGDLLFLDPPYSAVQYSRFYHVLESVVRPLPFDASGSGRYPPRAMRPQSDFSTGKARLAMAKTLEAIARVGARAVLTFPAGVASNGLSGYKIARDAERLFRVELREVESRYSTLGGTKDEAHRAPRLKTRELIIFLGPRSTVSRRRL